MSSNLRESIAKALNDSKEIGDGWVLDDDKAISQILKLIEGYYQNSHQDFLDKIFDNPTMVERRPPITYTYRHYTDTIEGKDAPEREWVEIERRSHE